MAIPQEQRDKNTENKMQHEAEKGYRDAEKGKYRASQKGSSERMQLSGPGSYSAGHDMGIGSLGQKEYAGKRGKALGEPVKGTGESNRIRFTTGYSNVHDKLARKKSQHEV